MNSIVSIIVPVYNVEKYLRDCLNSIVIQTYKSIEIILVDDGSTDLSGSICDEFAHCDSRVRAIHKENGGLSDARNVGLDLSTGDYVLFVDSDDMITPDMVEELMNTVSSADGSVDMVYFGFAKIYKNKTVYDCPIKAEYDKCEALRKWVEDIDIHNYACSAIYKKSLWDDIRFPKGKLYEDIRTTYKLILRCDRVLSVDKPLYIYRQRLGSITRHSIDGNRFQSLEATKALENVNAIANDHKCRVYLYDRLLRVKGYLLIDLLSTVTEKYEDMKREYYCEYRKNSRHILMSSSFPKSLKMLALLSIFGLKVLEHTFSQGFMNRYYSANYEYYD